MILNINGAILIGLIACILGIITSMISKNYRAAMWAFSAFLWCLNAAFK